MSNIYKIIQLDKENKIRQITVYLGYNYYDNINEDFSKDPNNSKFKDYFDEELLNKIITNKLSVLFTRDSIHNDDTIETLKKKIIKLNDSISFEEIYLFYKKIQDVNNNVLYENLTQNSKFPLTYDILIQYLLNIDNFNIDNIVKKDIYTFNDVIELNLSSNKQIVNHSLGQRTITNTDVYNYNKSI